MSSRDRNVPSFMTLGFSYAASSDFFYNFGAGIKIWLTEKAGLRLEARLWTERPFGISGFSFIGGISFSFSKR